MKEPINPSLTRWEKSELTYRNYDKYLKEKRGRFHLTLIDLLYVSNFKGGNSTINELENEVNEKLKNYSKILSEIDEKFKEKELRDLADDELGILLNKVQNVFNLVKDSNTKIDGFSYSYLSTLMHFYFPELLPILDRRVLINSGIISSDPKEKQVDKSGQVNKIEKYYDDLIKYMREKLKNSKMKLRDLDKQLFIIEIPKIEK